MKRIHQINKLKQLLPLLFLTIIGLGSCDTFKEDHVLAAQKQDNRIDVLALSQNATIIDLKTVIAINSPINIKITDEPRVGSLESLGNDLLKYTPPLNLFSGKEQLVFSVSGVDQGFLFSDTVNIEIINQVQDSCAFYAVLDQYWMPRDSVKIFNVLANDFICDASARLSITKQPTTGTAQIEGTTIKYTSGSSNTIDDLVYTVTNDSGQTTSALVLINVGAVACEVQLTDDRSTFNLSVPIVKFDLLWNDELCDKEVVASVATQPLYGTASFDAENHLSYVADKDSSYMDSLIYQVCYTGGCKQATATFDIVSSMCNIKAFEDFYNLSDTTLVNGIDLDVLFNDKICGDVSLSVILSPTNGTASISNNYIHYLPINTVVQNDSLKYRICNSDSSVCDSATVTIQ